MFSSPTHVHVTTATNYAAASLTGTPLPPEEGLWVSGYDYITSYPIGTTVVGTNGIMNNGTVPKTPTVSITGPDADEFVLANDTCTGVALAPQAQCTFDALFEPATVGAKTATVEVVWETGTTSAALANASAFQMSDPYVTSKPMWIDFHTVGVGTSASVPLVFENHGLTTSLPLMFDFTEPTAGYSLADDTCTGAVLVYGDTCTLTVVFTPTSTGTKTSWLNIAVPGGSQSHLTGVGN
jgi:hypothetical protein